MEIRKRNLVIVGALAGAGALAYVLLRPRRAKLNEEALRRLTPAEAEFWRQAARMGEAVPCPLQLAPFQVQCRPQSVSPAEMAQELARQKKAAQNPGLPPPIGSSPERIAAYNARVMNLAIVPVHLAGIKTAYDRLGAAVLGQPLAPAIGVSDKGFMQTFTGRGGYPAAIFMRRGSPAYAVHSGFYDFHRRFGSLGWPIENERRVAGLSPIDRRPIGVSDSRGTWHTAQRFSRGVMTWNPVTQNVAIKIGNRAVWNSIRRPPVKDKAWYEDTWDFTVEHAGTVVAVAEAVTLLPGVVGAVGVGVVLAPFTGGASLVAAGGVVVGAALAVKATKQGVDGLLHAADEGDVGAGAEAAGDL